MKIKTHRHHDVPVMELSGTLEGGPDNLRILGHVSRYAAKHDHELVMNLRKVKWITSTGLGILMRARNRFLEHGGSLKLCEMNERSLSLLAITRTRLLFDVYETEDDAVEAGRTVT